MVFWLVWAPCLLVAPGQPAAILVSPQGTSFVEKGSGQPFVPWGFNYDHDETGRLLEDYWDREWDKVERDFQTMKSLGANTVRIHLQVGKFFKAKDQINQEALERVSRLVTLSKKTELRLNLTGLGCYHKNDVPPWYDELSETERWETQKRFWRSLAQITRSDPGVFCFDLMNEPVVSGSKRKSGDWLGPPFGGKHFVQFITLDPAGRPRKTIAKAWIDSLVREIKSIDPDRLVTVGLVDWSLDRPGLTSGFAPGETCGSLDFLSVHLYPETGKLNQARETLKGFSLGKPLVLEETFPLKCSPRVLGDFLIEQKPQLAGVFSFYWGKPPEALKKSPTLQDAILAQWLEEFARARTAR